MALVTDGNNAFKIADGKSLSFTDENSVAALTISADGTVNVAGNLNVTGATTTVSAQDLLVKDKTIVVADAASGADLDGSGIKFGSEASAISFLYNDTQDRFISSEDISAANFIGDLTGNADSADTADKWDSEMTLNLSGDLSGSVSFDGSSTKSLNATIAAGSVEHGMVNFLDSSAALGTSNVVVPTQGAVKTYVDGVASSAASDRQAIRDEFDLADSALQVQISSNDTDIANATTDRQAIRDEFDLADSALQAELDLTQSGAGLSAAGAYVADASSNYLDSAVSLFDADMKLDAQIKTLSDNISSGAIGGGALEMKVGDGNGQLENFVSKSEHFEINDSTATSVTLSELVGKHSSELEELVMVFINGQKLRSKADGVAKDYDFVLDAGANTVIDFSGGSVDLEAQDDVEVIYFSKVSA